MYYTTVANTNIKVSRVSFGTASLHHVMNSNKRTKLLEAALSLGITHFDTSPYYGYGLAELDIGKLLSERRSNLTISTKVGLYSPGGASQSVPGIWARKIFGKFNSKLSSPQVDWCIKHANQSLNASLKRLNTDYVDFLFLHEPDISMIETEEFMYWIESVKQQGKIRFGGLAGLPNLLQPWIEDRHPLSSLLQTKDGISERGMVDSFLRVGCKPQFTYGYLSEISKYDASKSVDKIMRDAFSRNTSGSIIISTRKVARLREFITSES